MASVCAPPIKGVVLRVVKLDTCGIPVTGAGALCVVSKLFTQVQMTPQYEDGTEFFERTADGDIGVNQKDQPIFKRAQLQVDLLSVDPDMMPMVISARELVTAAPVSGYGFSLAEGASSAHFSLEVWQRVAGAGACTPGGAEQFIYNAWPHCTNTQVQAYTISNARSTLQFQCETQAAASAWGSGPGTTKYLPASGSTTAQTTDHWLWNITTEDPPTPVCGSSALT